MPGIVYGFNVEVPSRVAQLAKSRGVVVKSHNVIYKLIDDLRQRLTERLPPLQVEEVVGWFDFAFLCFQGDVFLWFDK